MGDVKEERGGGGGGKVGKFVGVAENDVEVSVDDVGAAGSAVGAKR